MTFHFKWEKEKANDPFLRQPFGDNWGRVYLGRS